MGTNEHKLAKMSKNWEKFGFIRLMGRCIRRFGRPRKIVRGPRGTNFPPPAPNLSLCPKDLYLSVCVINRFQQFLQFLVGQHSKPLVISLFFSFFSHFQFLPFHKSRSGNSIIISAGSTPASKIASISINIQNNVDTVFIFKPTKKSLFTERKSELNKMKKPCKA